MFKFNSSIHILVGFLILSNVICKTYSITSLGKYWNFFGFNRINGEEEDIDFDESEEEEEKEEEEEVVEEEEENNSEELCYVCYQEKLTVKLQPCGHMIGNFCANFIEQTTKKPCPTCRQEITQFENLVPLNVKPEEIYKQIYDNERHSKPEKLSIDDYNDLIFRVRYHDITPEEIKAQYYYLRRGQEPDKKLLEDINSSMGYIDRYKWKEFIGSVLKYCSRSDVEHKLYCQTFQRKLNKQERCMLKQYYERKGLDVKLEFFFRKRYMKFDDKDSTTIFIK
ncbi:uncharacterized protein LOC126904399 isoform X2 [Daktulosphaira vitifoliae]|uniref:uncharacterized protein LOC126904399 isoform X2 n=1 Tax=Daktulosphaira vitifoliae TaxID=58002 RepID=UPI0021A9CEB0|nr:uncharacterized protein LOC126904399 isoform X2 [Daktulosphaira vitifoliae]